MDRLKMTRKLHIGGVTASPGWEILNANVNSTVDHIGNANDLSRFPDNTFNQIYASHVAEHLDYMDELADALVGWNRVLVPGGRLFVSVPDLDVLAHLLLQKDRLDINERFHVMRMIFGGHVDKFDYHVVGLNQDFLAAFLHNAGFVKIRRVQSFGLFHDTSDMNFKGVSISLNLIAEKMI